MNGELVKRQDRWDLYAEDGSKIGSSAKNPMNKLSIKNCEAVANGYDLDELAEQNWRIGLEECIPTPATHVTSFKAGFQKALEILGDKKFSEEDMMQAIITTQVSDSIKNNDDRLELIQSLQQTEWDVEIEMWFYGTRHKKGEWIPKLDADGCLILKRK